MAAQNPADKKQNNTQPKNTKTSTGPTLIVLHGMPGVGKYTVGKQFCDESKSDQDDKQSKNVNGIGRFKLFHNHLIVDSLLSIFPFGSKPFIELREKHWLQIFEQSCQFYIDENSKDESKSNLTSCDYDGILFTFSFENTVNLKLFFTKVLEIFETKYNGKVFFVELVCDKNELLQRMQSDKRKKDFIGKLTDVKLFETLIDNGAMFSGNNFITKQLKRNNIIIKNSDINQTCRSIADKIIYEMASATAM